MWPFRTKKHQPLPTLRFTSVDSFFEMQCKLGDTDLEEGKAVVALVLDASKIAGTKTAVKVDADGSQTAMVRVASNDGGFVVPAKTPGPGDPLAPGDLVMWVPGKWLKEMAAASDDPRFGWVGLIRAKVKPEMTPGNSWELVCRYD
jgi:hypothetical protein